MDFEPVTAGVLFAVAVLAGLVDAIAGGGGLLTIPALLWAGIPPAAALATNKLQACFGSGSASFHFIQAGRVDPKDFRLALLTCLLGAVAGAVSINRLDSAWLQNLIPLLLMGAALFFLFCPPPPPEGHPPRITPRTYGLIVPPLIGFYDGFFGPGTGSFLVLSLVTLLGLDLAHATARTKVLNFASNIASLAVFILAGHIIWTLGLVMAVGQAVGARIGTKLVLTNGASLIRPVLVLISLALTLRLILSAP